MTKEEKQILIEDLCGRLPYPIWGLHRGENLPLYVMDNSGSYMVLGYNAWFNLDTVPFKPYFRPMSSMTEEEVKEIQKINWQFWKPENGLIECFVGDADDGYCSVSQMASIIDYLNAHHFDYRGLIDKGLALEAPEDMYKTE